MIIFRPKACRLAAKFHHILFDKISAILYLSIGTIYHTLLLMLILINNSAILYFISVLYLNQKCLASPQYNYFLLNGAGGVPIWPIVEIDFIVNYT